MMLNKTWAFVVALALAAAPVSSLLAAAPGAAAQGGTGPGASVGGVAGGAPGASVGGAAGGAATSKRSQRIAPRHRVAAPQGTRQPIVRGKQPTPPPTRHPAGRSTQDRR
jgi:hypothetical protein